MTNSQLTNDVYRLCVGAHHQPDCHHREYMRQGVEEFLASERTREALIYAVTEERAAEVLGVLTAANRRPWEEI